jgi:hypothetical protein
MPVAYVRLVGADGGHIHCSPARAWPQIIGLDMLSPLLITTAAGQSPRVGVDQISEKHRRTVVSGRRLRGCWGSSNFEDRKRMEQRRQEGSRRGGRRPRDHPVKIRPAARKACSPVFQDESGFYRNLSS